MFTNKQDQLNIVTGQAKFARVSRWSGFAAAMLLLGVCAGPVRAQQDSTDGVPRTGDKPDTTVKKDSVPMGAKTKQAAKKSDKKTDKGMAKTTPMKTSGKDAKKGSGKTGYVAKRVVLVFPVDAKGAAAEQLSDIITDVEKARLASTGNFGTVSFLASLPSIRRGLSEQSLTPTDIHAPFATTAKAQRLTTAAGYDAAMISSLDSYEYNADNQNVTMVLSIQMIDYSGATPRNYTAANTVTTPAKSVKNATDTTATTEAARNLTEQLMTDVLKAAAAAKAMPAGGTGTTGAATPPAK